MPFVKLPKRFKLKSIGTDIATIVRKSLALGSHEPVRRAVLFCSLGLICLGLYGIGNRMFHYIQEDKQFANIKALTGSSNPEEQFSIPDFPVIPVSPSGSVENNAVKDNHTLTAPNIELPYLVVLGDPKLLNSSGKLENYEALLAQNSHMVGWIHMPGFRKAIDYPIMQTTDNEYYLNKDFYQNTSYAGSIFMDYRNSAEHPERNMILYGHAMNDMSMFGNLKDYPDHSSDYARLVTIYIDLMDTRLEYEVFSTYTEDASYPCLQTTFTDDSDYLAFLQKIQLHSVHDYKCSLTPQDKILTLSTCNTTLFKDGRSIVHARLIRQVVYDGPVQGSYETSAVETKKVTNAVSANVYLNSLKLFHAKNTSISSIELADLDEFVSEPNTKSTDKSTNEPTTSQPPDELSSEHADDTLPLWSELVLDPFFDTVNKNFEVTVPNTGNVALLIEPADPKARLQILMNGYTVDSLSAAMLKDGLNVLSIKVISRDGLYSRIYSINIVRESGETGIDGSQKLIDMELTGKATSVSGVELVIPGNITPNAGIGLASPEKNTSGAGIDLTAPEKNTSDTKTELAAPEFFESTVP